jgi:hypothetical protein
MFRSAILAIALGLFSISGQAQTAEDYAKACFQNDARSCCTLGSAYYTGTGVRAFNKSSGRLPDDGLPLPVSSE